MKILQPRLAHERIMNRGRGCGLMFHSDFLGLQLWRLLSVLPTNRCWSLCGKDANKGIESEAKRELPSPCLELFLCICCLNACLHPPPLGWHPRKHQRRLLRISLDCPLFHHGNSIIPASTTLLTTSSGDMGLFSQAVPLL